jgi:peptidoglycan/LPS O-acetylase OafA/YrhL
VTGAAVRADRSAGTDPPPATNHPPEGYPVRSRTRELEGYRGLAAVSVVVFHVWQMFTVYDADGPHPPTHSRPLTALVGFEGIDLFFVMSAYLLAISYARAAVDGSTVRPARVFLFRRAVRIVPLYWTAVLVVWASRNPSLPGDWVDLVEHLTFTQVFDDKRIFYTIGPSWSLCLEIIFYGLIVALGPLAARACRRMTRRSSRVAFCLAGCGLLYFGSVAWVSVAYWVLHLDRHDYPVYFGPQARMDAFAAGMVVAVLVVAWRNRTVISGKWAVVLRVVAFGVLLTLGWLFSGKGPVTDAVHVHFHSAAALAWALLVATTVLGPTKQRWIDAFAVKWLTGLGLISYSLYMWHEPVLLQLDKFGLLPSRFPVAVLVVLSLALPAAVISYWLIEYPTGLLGKVLDKDGRLRNYYPELDAEAAAGSPAGKGAARPAKSAGGTVAE